MYGEPCLFSPPAIPLDQHRCGWDHVGNFGSSTWFINRPPLRNSLKSIIAKQAWNHAIGQHFGPGRLRSLQHCRHLELQLQSYLSNSSVTFALSSSGL